MNIVQLPCKGQRNDEKKPSPENTAVEQWDFQCNPRGLVLWQFVKKKIYIPILKKIKKVAGPSQTPKTSKIRIAFESFEILEVFISMLRGGMAFVHYCSIGCIKKIQLPCIHCQKGELRKAKSHSILGGVDGGKKNHQLLPGTLNPKQF